MGKDGQPDEIVMFARIERMFYIGGLVWNIGVFVLLVYLAFFVVKRDGRQA